MPVFGVIGVLALHCNSIRGTQIQQVQISSIQQISASRFTLSHLKAIVPCMPQKKKVPAKSPAAVYTENMISPIVKAWIERCTTARSFARYVDSIGIGTEVAVWQHAVWYWQWSRSLTTCCTRGTHIACKACILNCAEVHMSTSKHAVFFTHYLFPKSGCQLQVYPKGLMQKAWASWRDTKSLCWQWRSMEWL